MRPDTKLKVARRKHTIEVLRWLYARRAPKLDGAALSLEHRQRQRGSVANSRPLTYGEVDVPDFLCILDIVKPREGEVFVDLGSGTGKAVLAAACGFPEFSKCQGIELVQGLADAANDHLRTMQAVLENSDADSDVTRASGTMKSGLHQKGGTSTTPSTVGGSDGELLAGGKGWGGQKRGTRNKKTADQGLDAAQLEELIADMLTDPSASASGTEIGSGEEGSGRATAEDIASRLVQELGHQRYKASLRGHGGLKKFLANLCSNQTSGRVDIAVNGGTVALKQTVELLRAAEDSLLHACCEEVSNGGAPAILNAEGAESSDAALNPKLQGVGCVSRKAVSPQATSHHRLSLTSPLQSTSASTTTSSGASMLVVPLISSDISLSAAARMPSASSARSPPTEARSYAACDDASGSVSAGSGRRVERDDAGVGRRRLPEAGPLTREMLSRVELMCGDIFQEPWSHGGVVYVASLLFDDSMMAKLGDRVEELSKGARIISLRPIFPRSSRIENISSANDIDNGGVARSTVVLRLVHDGVFRMSWQMARVYIYVRL